MIRTDISPAQLAECIALATALYERHAAFYQIDLRLRFVELPYRTKELWIDRALEVIEMVGPSRTKVIATITPDAPWGISA